MTRGAAPPGERLVLYRVKEPWPGRPMRIMTTEATARLWRYSLMTGVLSRLVATGAKPRPWLARQARQGGRMGIVAGGAAVGRRFMNRPLFPICTDLAVADKAESGLAFDQGVGVWRAVTAMTGGASSLDKGQVAGGRLLCRLLQGGVTGKTEIGFSGAQQGRMIAGVWRVAGDARKGGEGRVRPGAGGQKFFLRVTGAAEGIGLLRGEEHSVVRAVGLVAGRTPALDKGTVLAEAGEFALKRCVAS